MGLFQYNRLKLNARIGVGFTRLNDFYLNFNPDLTFPVGLNSTFLLSDKKKGTLSFELMGGNTFSTYIRANHNYQPEREFDSHRIYINRTKLDLYKRSLHPANILSIT